MVETSSEIPAHLVARVQRELEPGEAVMWMGQPDSHIPLLRMLIVLPLALVFFGFMEFTVVWAVISTGNNFVGWALSVLALVILLGIVFLVSLPWSIRIWARTSVYVITDRRALTFNWRLYTAVRRFRPEQLRGAYIDKRRKDVGTIVLKSDLVWWRYLAQSPGLKTQRYFVNVHKPEMVLAMIHTLAGVHPEIDAPAGEAVG